jgi:pre-mRNA-splicing factor 38A
MANTTDPEAASIHGTNPQFLVEKITRSKIYNAMYWKEHCFALDAETVIDKCMELRAVGGAPSSMLLQPMPASAMLCRPAWR